MKNRLLPVEGCSISNRCSLTFARPVCLFCFVVVTVKFKGALRRAKGQEPNVNVVSFKICTNNVRWCVRMLFEVKETNGLIE